MYIFADIGYVYVKKLGEPVTRNTHYVIIKPILPYNTDAVARSSRLSGGKPKKPVSAQDENNIFFFRSNTKNVVFIYKIYPIQENRIS